MIETSLIVRQESLGRRLGHRRLESLLCDRGHQRITGGTRMNSVECQPLSIVLSIRGSEHRVIISHRNALLRRKLHDPLIELSDALEPLRCGVCLFCDGFWSPWWDGSNHHGYVILFRYAHHGLDVDGSV